MDAQFFSCLSAARSSSTTIYYNRLHLNLCRHSSLSCSPLTTYYNTLLKLRQSPNSSSLISHLCYQNSHITMTVEIDDHHHLLRLWHYTERYVHQPCKVARERSLCKCAAHQQWCRGIHQILGDRLALRGGTDCSDCAWF